MSGDPLVSVVLIGYNDAARITRALDSIRRQTLRSIEIIVVDDASTDATAEVVESIAAVDARVRFLQRAENSGGCSAPRNDGLAIARAPWVMFCDSDDAYELHACATLLRAAEKWDADLVCGTAIRHDIKRDRDKRWRPQLHSCDRLVRGLEQEPELLYDTISVNKIYRRSFLVDNDITFPPGLLFEDQVFTLRCFLAAERIGLIQASVYIWNVDRLAEEASITQGRMQQRNVVDRIEINRRMDALLAESSEELRLAKDIKFLRHEGYLYLSAIGENPDISAAQTMVDVFSQYVAGVDARAFAHIRPALRVACYALLNNELDLLRRAMRWERWASVVDTVVVRDGSGGDARDYWRSPDQRAVLGLQEREWLDVSHLKLLDMPFSVRRYFHELREISVSRATVNVTIDTTDFASDLVSDVQAHLVWSDRMGTVIASLPLAASAREEGGRVRWRGSGPVTAHIQRPLMKPDKGSVGVRLTRGAEVNTTVVRSPVVDVDGVFVPIPSVAFADRPAGALLLPGERASVGWQPGGLASGPVAWGRRAGHAVRRRLPGSNEELYRARKALLPGSVDLATDRPLVAYLPAPSAGGPRSWPMDLTAWDELMADVCYLAVAGDVSEAVPTRLWGSIRDARALPLGQILDAARLVITDDPSFVDIAGPSIVFRPDDGASRYLLPDLPEGYPVLRTTLDVAEAVRHALGELA